MDKCIYILNCQMTGINGNILHFTESAFLNLDTANDRCDQMIEAYKGDPNFVAHITEPIFLDET